MFVVWQKGKARVVMDQTASGLNDGIPSRDEAKVKYEDMHTFGQVLNDVIKEHPNEELVLFKSDVAKAFLNLPAHPLWHLCQVARDWFGNPARERRAEKRGTNQINFRQEFRT
ncbi:hypothetical protein EV360DRAFT_88216 [Lentinula raphanica]|nr:hypothetical protein EV360DRAFT_88216 [Lentinula raphanica]